MTWSGLPTHGSCSQRLKISSRARLASAWSQQVPPTLVSDVVGIFAWVSPAHLFLAWECVLSLRFLVYSDSGRFPSCVVLPAVWALLPGCPWWGGRCGWGRTIVWSPSVSIFLKVHSCVRWGVLFPWPSCVRSRSTSPPPALEHRGPSWSDLPQIMHFWVSLSHCCA